MQKALGLYYRSQELLYCVNFQVTASSFIEQLTLFGTVVCGNVHKFAAGSGCIQAAAMGHFDCAELFTTAAGHHIAQIFCTISLKRNIQCTAGS